MHSNPYRADRRFLRDELQLTPTHDAPESTLPMPNRGVVQRLPNHTSEVPSKNTLSPTERRDQVAKLYRARLWLACAGIYRRGRQWEGAQAAIQDRPIITRSCRSLVRFRNQVGRVGFKRGMVLAWRNL